MRMGVGMLLLPLLPAACGEEAGKSGKLTIATAANMQFAMDSLVHAFSESTGVTPPSWTDRPEGVK